MADYDKREYEDMSLPELWQAFQAADEKGDARVVTQTLNETARRLSRALEGESSRKAANNVRDPLNGANYHGKVLHGTIIDKEGDTLRVALDGYPTPTYIDVTVNLPSQESEIHHLRRAVYERVGLPSSQSNNPHADILKGSIIKNSSMSDVSRKETLMQAWIEKWKKGSFPDVKEQLMARELFASVLKQAVRKEHQAEVVRQGRELEVDGLAEYEGEDEYALLQSMQDDLSEEVGTPKPLFGEINQRVRLENVVLTDAKGVEITTDSTWGKGVLLSAWADVGPEVSPIITKEGVKANPNTVVGSALITYTSGLRAHMRRDDTGAKKAVGLNHSKGFIPTQSFVRTFGGEKIEWSDGERKEIPNPKKVSDVVNYLVHASLSDEEVSNLGTPVALLGRNHKKNGVRVEPMVFPLNATEFGRDGKWGVAGINQFNVLQDRTAKFIEGAALNDEELTEGQRKAINLELGLTSTRGTTAPVEGAGAYVKNIKEMRAHIRELKSWQLSDVETPHQVGVQGFYRNQCLAEMVYQELKANPEVELKDLARAVHNGVNAGDLKTNNDKRKALEKNLEESAEVRQNFLKEVGLLNEAGNFTPAADSLTGLSLTDLEQVAQNPTHGEDRNEIQDQLFIFKGVEVPFGTELNNKVNNYYTKMAPTKAGVVPEEHQGTIERVFAQLYRQNAVVDRSEEINAQVSSGDYSKKYTKGTAFAHSIARNLLSDHAQGRWTMMVGEIDEKGNLVSALSDNRANAEADSARGLGHQLGGIHPEAAKKGGFFIPPNNGGVHYTISFGENNALAGKLKQELLNIEPGNIEVNPNLTIALTQEIHLPVDENGKPDYVHKTGEPLSQRDVNKQTASYRKWRKEVKELFTEENRLLSTFDKGKGTTKDLGSHLYFRPPSNKPGWNRSSNSNPTEARESMKLDEIAEYQVAVYEILAVESLYQSKEEFVEKYTQGLTKWHQEIGEDLGKFWDDVNERYYTVEGLEKDAQGVATDLISKRWRDGNTGQIKVESTVVFKDWPQVKIKDNNAPLENVGDAAVYMTTLLDNLDNAEARVRGKEPVINLTMGSYRAQGEPNSSTNSLSVYLKRDHIGGKWIGGLISYASRLKSMPTKPAFGFSNYPKETTEKKFNNGIPYAILLGCKVEPEGSEDRVLPFSKYDYLSKAFRVPTISKEEVFENEELRKRSSTNSLKGSVKSGIPRDLVAYATELATAPSAEELLKHPVIRYYGKDKDALSGMFARTFAPMSKTGEKVKEALDGLRASFKVSKEYITVTPAENPAEGSEKTSAQSVLRRGHGNILENDLFLVEQVLEGEKEKELNGALGVEQYYTNDEGKVGKNGSQGYSPEGTYLTTNVQGKTELANAAGVSDLNRPLLVVEGRATLAALAALKEKWGSDHTPAFQNCDLLAIGSIGNLDRLVGTLPEGKEVVLIQEAPRFDLSEEDEAGVRVGHEYSERALNGYKDAAAGLANKPRNQKLIQVDLVDVMQMGNVLDTVKMSDLGGVWLQASTPPAPKGEVLDKATENVMSVLYHRKEQGEKGSFIREFKNVAYCSKKGADVADLLHHTSMLTENVMPPDTPTDRKQRMIADVAAAHLAQQILQAAPENSRIRTEALAVQQNTAQSVKTMQDQAEQLKNRMAGATNEQGRSAEAQQNQLAEELEMRIKGAKVSYVREGVRVPVAWEDIKKMAAACNAGAYAGVENFTAAVTNAKNNNSPFRMEVDMSNLGDEQKSQIRQWVQKELGLVGDTSESFPIQDSSQRAEVSNTRRLGL